MKKIFIIFSILFLVIIFFIFKFNKKYINNYSIHSQIAKPIFLVENNSPSIIDINNLKSEYFFTVKNYQDEQMSDIPFLYNIEFSNIEDSNVILHIYKDSEELLIQNNRTPDIILKNSEKEIHTFKLIVEYANIVNKNFENNINLKVFSEQYFE